VRVGNSSGNGKIQGRYRFETGPVRASWIAEYGDPDKPEEWEWLQTYSAYHLAKPGQSYPPILFVTTRRDDRVHPGHARKMTAKLQAMGYEAYFYEPAAGGHGYGKDNKERATSIVLGYSFLKSKIGWDDGGVGS
jgi:prolyl oligopeptidase